MTGSMTYVPDARAQPCRHCQRIGEYVTLAGRSCIEHLNPEQRSDATAVPAPWARGDVEHARAALLVTEIPMRGDG